MKVFRIDRLTSTWCEDFSMVVIAKDKLHAERKARWSSEDFKKCELKVTEIKLDKERVVLVANNGA